MGFSVIIDILGATVIGGILMMNLFQINNSAVENNYTGNGELIGYVQSSSLGFLCR